MTALTYDCDGNFTDLQTSKNLNGDFLFTYLVHPGTAVYVGYTSNLENILVDR